MRGQTRVLVVESDPEARARIRAWLEAKGMWVMTCPGPARAPDECPVGRQEPCPYVETVDAVVLDGRLDADRTHLGPPPNALAVAYVDAGKPLVVLSDAEAQPPEPAVVVLPRDASGRRVAKAVRTLVRRP